MAGSSGTSRKVHFQTATPEEPGKGEKIGLCKRLRSLFGGKRKGEPALIVFEAPKNGGAKAAPAPFGFAEPEVAAPATAAPDGNEADSLIDSLPNYKAREDAAAAMRMAYGDVAPTLEQMKEALVCDTGKGERDMAKRKGVLFALAFGRKKEHMMGTGALANIETVNVFYYRIDRFSRMVTMLRMQGEEEELRSKCGDRLSMLQAVERMLFSIPRAERIGAFELIAGIAMKMGETLCTREVCRRMENVLGTMASGEGDKLAMLANMHGIIMKVGVRPSGRDMRTNRWIASRLERGVMDAAAMAWEKKKPGSHLEFMRMLEEEDCDTANRRLHVLEEAVGERAGETWKEYQAADIAELRAIAWNIGYYCVQDIRFVADFAKGMPDEERVRLAALDTMLWVARRMPPGRRMEAPQIIARAVEKLTMPDEELGIPAESKVWVVTAWLGELRTYMNEPNAETAYKRLSWLPMDPMKVVNYLEK